jgi:hypothetical protein
MYTEPNQESHFLITRQFQRNGLAQPLLVNFPPGPCGKQC